MADALFVCVMPADCCSFCGEWVSVEMPGGYPGPHGNHYCTEECCDAADAASRAAQLPTRVTGCRSCGLDNFEHTDDCEETHATPTR